VQDLIFLYDILNNEYDSISIYILLIWITSLNICLVLKNDNNNIIYRVLAQIFNINIQTMHNIILQQCIFTIKRIKTAIILLLKKKLRFKFKHVILKHPKLYKILTHYEQHPAIEIKDKTRVRRSIHIVSKYRTWFNLL